ncbi:MAG: hypothetical protein DA328_04470 [Nitrososphaeraceae archaeon]|nr:hypothetical protein [Nitrososphaeraceae archaeon]
MLIEGLASALDYPGEWKFVNISGIKKVASQLRKDQYNAFEILFNAWAKNNQGIKEAGYSNPGLQDAFSRANYNPWFWFGADSYETFYQNMK